MSAITFHPRHYVPCPWTPLTRQEFDELARWLPSLREHEPRRGRRLDNPRRAMDAIFWMACSRGPWRELPPELGKPDTAHRMLRRWAKTGHLDRLVMALSTHPLAGGSKLLRSMGYWICRAWLPPGGRRCGWRADSLPAAMAIAANGAPDDGRAKD